MAKMGRPPKEIDEKNFKNLCALQCTEEEIAAFFECTVDTINNWCKKTYGDTFSETYKIYSAAGKMSLRRFQFRLAEKNPGMAIFLGKNWLGQSDKIEQTVMDVEDLSPLAEMLKNDIPKSDEENADN